MCQDCKQEPCVCDKPYPNKEVKEHTKVKSRITGHEHEIQPGPLPGRLITKNPFVSQAQAGYLHSHPEILGDKIKEWDAASKGKKLPERAK